MSTGIIIDQAIDVAFTPAGTIAATNVQAAIEEVAAEAGGSTLPVPDTTAIAKGSADPTKEVRLEVDGLTTGVTRVLTVPDADITLVGLGIAQTFTALQTFTGGLDSRRVDPSNQVFGGGAGAGITTAADCTLVGYNAGSSITSGGNNTVVGSGANTSGGANVVVGSQSSTGGTNFNSMLGYANAANGFCNLIGSQNSVVSGYTSASCIGSANVFTGAKSNSLAVGNNNTVAHSNCTVFGTLVTTTADGQFWIAGRGASPNLVLAGNSSAGDSSPNPIQASTVSNWDPDPTHATRKARRIDYIHDAGGAREATRLESNGTEALIGFGGGTLFKKILSATAVLDYPSIPALSEASLTITVPGAVTTGEPSVALGWSASLPDGVVVKQARVSAVDTVSIRLANYTAVSVNPAAITCRAVVFQF